jgi:hypothetical protein
VNWYNISENSSAGSLLAQHISKIDWPSFCSPMSWSERVI